ncbi:MAG TPA: PEGA domain-containing protein [Terriglobales bacterium]
MNSTQRQPVSVDMTPRNSDAGEQTPRTARPLLWTLPVILALLLSTLALANDNKVMAEIQFQAKTDIEKDSGVWVDGEYVGYVKELHGSKKIMLLPGDHMIVVRQDGYEDYVQHVMLQPKEVRQVFVVMAKAAATPPLSDVTATVKVAINPSRAAVFLDGEFVGHAGEFEGAGRGLLVSPGKHRIKVALPGFQTFETDINPTANQKIEVKTDLAKAANAPSGPLVEGGDANPVAPSDSPQPNVTVPKEAPSNNSQPSNPPQQ